MSLKPIFISLLVVVSGLIIAAVVMPGVSPPAAPLPGSAAFAAEFPNAITSAPVDTYTSVPPVVYTPAPDPVTSWSATIGGTTSGLITSATLVTGDGMQQSSGYSGVGWTGHGHGLIVISAQNPGEAGSVTCEIKNTTTGVVVSSNVTTAPYGVVSCSGRV